MSPGDIFICDLGEPVGSEQGGHNRPVIVVSNPKACAFSDVIYVVPLTSKSKTYVPQHYSLYKIDYDCLKYDENIALCEQTKPVSKQRLRGKMGVINPEDLYQIVIRCKKNFPF